MASGFSLGDISGLKWKDIEIVKGYDDFVVVHIARDQVQVSIHDFSRPVIPDVARYLKRVYRELDKRLDPGVLAETYVVTAISIDEEFEPDHKFKPAESKEITNEAQNLLARAGFRSTFTEPGRPGGKEPIPATILRSNYQRLLQQKAGLKNDPDTYYFLIGQVFGGSTSTSYESHVSPEARDRMYAILKPLSVERKVKRVDFLEKTENKLIVRAVPENNHEVALLNGQISILPRTRVTIRILHGLTGSVRKKK